MAMMPRDQHETSGQDRGAKTRGQLHHFASHSRPEPPGSVFNNPRLPSSMASMESHLSPSNEVPSPASVAQRVASDPAEDITNHNDDGWSEEDEEEGPKRKRARPLSE